MYLLTQPNTTTTTQTPPYSSEMYPLKQPNTITTTQTPPYSTDKYPLIQPYTTTTPHQFTKNTNPRATPSPTHPHAHTPTRPPPPACQSGSSRPAAQPSTPSPFRSTTAQTATEWLCPSNNQFDAAQSGSRLTNSQLPDVLLGNKWPLQLRNPLGSKTNE